MLLRTINPSSHPVHSIILRSIQNTNLLFGVSKDPDKFNLSHLGLILVQNKGVREVISGSKKTISKPLSIGGGIKMIFKNDLDAA